MTSTIAKPRTFFTETITGGLVSLSAEPYAKSPHLFRYRWWCECDAVEQRWHRDCAFTAAVEAAESHAAHCTYDPSEDLAREVAAIKAAKTAAPGLPAEQQNALVAADPAAGFTTREYEAEMPALHALGLVETPCLYARLTAAGKAARAVITTTPGR